MKNRSIFIENAVKGKSRKMQRFILQYHDLAMRTMLRYQMRDF